MSKEEMTDLNKRERAILKFIEKQINYLEIMDML